MVRDAVETIDRTTADPTASAALAKLQTLRIAKLEHEVARLRRSQFGRSSEQHAADQLRLLFDEAMTSDAVTGAPANDDTPGEDAVPTIRRGGRAPLPAHLPRREIEHLPAAGGDRCDRPGCHGAQVRIGEDITEVLDYIPARFEVIRHRPRLACRACERIRQAPVPPLPIPKARATSALLAQLLVSRFADHLPWYRQSAILRRAGVAIDRDLMATGPARSPG